MRKLRESMKLFLSCLLFASSLLLFGGCPEEDGPFEEAGEELDEAADEAEDAID